jgi:hypothetical protein
LSKYGDAFDEHAIDGDILEKLNDDDLKQIGVKALGQKCIRGTLTSREEAATTSTSAISRRGQGNEVNGPG